MSFVKNPCPKDCPKVREQLRIAIKELPNVTDGIFPRKKNDVEPRLPSDVTLKDVPDEPKRIIETVYVHKIPVNDVRSEVLKDIETKPIVPQEIIEEPEIVIPTEKIADDVKEEIDLIRKEKLIQEPIIVQEEIVTPIEKIADDVKEEIDLIRKEKLIQEPIIVQEEIVIPTEKIVDDIKEKIDFVEEKKLVQEPAIIPKETVTPTEKIVVYNEKKIDFVKEEKLIQEPTIIPKETVTPPEKIIVHNEKKIDFVEEKKLVQEPTIIPKEIVTPPEKIIVHNEKKIDFVEEKKLVQEPTIIPKKIVAPPEKIIVHNEKKIDFVEEEKLVQEPAIIPKETVTPPEKIVVHNEKKIDFVEEEKLNKEPVTVQKEIIISTKRITDRDDEKINFVEKKKNTAVEEITAEPIQKVPIANKKPEIIENKNKLTPTKIELELPRELEEHFEPEERMEYSEEESITDYEKFIDEELQESLPVVIAREIPEEPKAVRREISRNATTLNKRIDRERPVRPPMEREAVTAMPEERSVEEEVSARRALGNSPITERIVSRKPAEDVCEETNCPLKEQKERIMRKLKIRQRVVNHYYLTKGFSYFEDICTCSLACMVYTLSRDPFVKSIFASLALFAVGLKLCSELDAWEMPNRVS